MKSTLKKLYAYWMKFAYIIGYVNTRILLSIMYYTVFTAFGLIARLLGFDLLDTKRKNLKSYWNKKEDYFRQF
ncbi:MAG: SxtJ family membrane protein [Methanosarcinales archaeon]